MTAPGRFDIEDGALKTVGGMGLLWHTNAPFGDCTIRVVFDDWHSTGVLDSIAKVPARAQKPVGEWNTMEIMLREQAKLGPMRRW